MNPLHALRFLRALALAATLAGLCATSGAQTAAPMPAQATPVADFTAAPGNGRYAFASSSPKTFAELVRATPGEPQTVEGYLFLAPGTAKGPAVVLMHGSGGLYSAILGYWPKAFNAAGLSVLVVDSFGPRGVQSTADDQSQVPFAADVADAFAALKLLASHPRVDPARIAIMGFSRGGITTWRAAVERVIAAQSPSGLRFAAHVPVYSGGCSGVFRLAVKPGVFSKAPELWIHGDADDYAPMAPCQDYARRIGEAGTPVEFVSIPGALHKFDSDDLKRHYLRQAQRSLPDCPVETDVDTLAIHDSTTGERLQGARLQEVLKSRCAALGASVEGNNAAREKARVAATDFLVRVLKP